MPATINKQNHFKRENLSNLSGLYLYQSRKIKYQFTDNHYLAISSGFMCN